MLYKATLDKIGLGMADISACATTLYGFSGEGIASVGATSLVVTFGEYLMSETRMMDFTVVDPPSTYNALLGRQILVGLGAMTSVRHLAMKFLTPRGTGIIRGDQLGARECYNISTCGRGHASA